jgi:uncharacterized protein
MENNSYQHEENQLLKTIVENGDTEFWNEKITNLDSIEIRRLADCYRKGKGVTQNFSKAVQLYIQAAEKEDNISMAVLGECYFEGLGVKKDIAEAFKWLVCAARKGKTSVLTTIEKYSENDWGQALFKEADRDGDLSYLLGYFYMHNRSNINYEKALNFLSDAAQVGSVKALRELADYYFLKKYGIYGLQKYASTALSYYLSAAKKGDAHSMFRLGKCYLGKCYFKGFGVEKNFNKAFKWLESAVKNGNLDSLIYLASCYENGTGVSQNYIKAIDLYIQAARQGFAEAMDALGKLYSMEVEHSVKDNLKKAVSLFLEEVDKESPEALYREALRCEYGVGITRDVSEAHILYWKASQRGHQKAKLRLEHLECILQTETEKLYMLGCGHQHGIETFKDIRLAAMYFLEVAKRGNKAALKKLLELNKYDYWVPQDDQSIKWFEVAINFYKEKARKGDRAAINIMNNLNISF